MVQVLVRATRLLEALAARPLCMLGDLSREVDLPPATCARLLAALAELGWADQVAPRGAWRLGSRAGSLAERRPFLEGLFLAGRPVLGRVVQQLGQPAVLVRLHGTQRQVMIVRTAPAFVPEGLPYEDRDVYRTASGRVLLANLPSRRRKRLLDELGTPRPHDWPGVVDRGELLSELARIRRSGFAEHLGHDWHALAVSAGCWHGEHTALGTFAAPGALHPESRRVLDTARAELAAAARVGSGSASV